MVVDDFDVVCVTRSPPKTDPPLLVDPSAVLASSIAFELLQAIAGRKPQVVEARRSIQHTKLPQRDSLNVAAQLAHRAALEQMLGVAVPEALDHTE